ncbi:MAG TPA: gluconokinase, partial [Gaiellaceae bacterium]|nr:gluconokinase [Gaiellaceae bacterium]
SARALLFDEEARSVGAGARVRYGPTRGHSGRLGVFDAEELVALSHEVVSEARRAAGGAVDAVAISCFWHSLVAVDARGRPLTGVLTWRDDRSAPDAESLARRLDEDAVHSRTGCPLHPSFWPAKLAWLRREQPEAFAEARRFVSFPDLLVDPARTSMSSASATGLLDQRTLAWDEELCAVLGVDPTRLPALDDGPEERDEPWFPAIGDGAAANLGAGCVTRDRATLTIGTSGALRVLHATADLRPRPGLFLYRLDAARVVEGGALSDGGNLHDWLERTLRLGEGASGSEPQSRLAERPPAGHGLAFLPLLGGERSPGWHPRAAGAITGLTFRTTPEDLLQAALEGVALRFAEIADLLPGVREVVATGKATAANHDWVQILADVLERPVTLSGAGEASARGAAVWALERLGASPPPPPSGPTFQPRADRTEAYRSARERQRRLYQAATEDGA